MAPFCGRGLFVSGVPGATIYSSSTFNESASTPLVTTSVRGEPAGTFSSGVNVLPRYFTATTSPAYSAGISSVDSCVNPSELSRADAWRVE